MFTIPPAASSCGAYLRSLLMNELKKGKARIICGSDKNYTDPKGNLWLKDQLFTDSGAYGSLNTHFCDRGNIELR